MLHVKRVLLTSPLIAKKPAKIPRTMHNAKHKF